MTLSAFQKGRIIVMGGGLQWRPLVHLSDVSQAFQLVIDANEKLVNREIFNVGLDNYQIKNLAYLVREQLPIDIEIDLAPDDADKRDYNVDFSKIKYTPTIIDKYFGENCLLPYNFVNNIKTNKYMYVSGAYYIIKKNIATTYLLDETLEWGQSEDVEYSKRLHEKEIIITCNHYSEAYLLKQKESIHWERLCFKS
jgi:hypothetical protein